MTDISTAAATIARVNPWSSGSISYSFTTTPGYTLPDQSVTTTAFTDAQKAVVRTALQTWSDVANVSFTEVSSGGSIQIVGMVSGTAYGYYPDYGGDIWVQTNINDLRHTAVHELGHALGLTHPGTYQTQSGATYANNAAFPEDTFQYTLMSYFAETNSGANFVSQKPESPMLFDIAAIQSHYGANTSAFSGNTTYGFNSNTGRDYLSTTGEHIIFSAWDTGGTDTFDFSGFSNNQKISLVPETFSSVGGIQGQSYISFVDNVSIMTGVTIENADGGSGNDTITGNTVGNALRGLNGNDIVYGGDGTDTVSGNGGDDYVYGDGGNDYVYGGQGADWVYGGAGNDTISGDLGNDIIVGDSGADRLVFGTGAGGDWILGFSSSEGDRVQVSEAYSQGTVDGQAVLFLAGGGAIGFIGQSWADVGTWAA